MRSSLVAVIVLFQLLLLLSACATVDRTYSNAVCNEKGITSTECAYARVVDAQSSNAKGQNTATGAVIGCILTGPFCLLGFGPLIGAAIGNSSSN